MADRLTKQQRSLNMSRIGSKNTKPEIIMFFLIKKTCYKFKKHYKILGKPDIVFPEYKVAVFINGEFWHGKDYKFIKNKISKFWVDKIGRNIARDRFVQRTLRKNGWRVINFWGKSVIRNPEKSLIRLLKFLEMTSVRI